MLELKEKAPHTREPQIITLPSRTMAVVHTRGEPDRVMHLVLPALYSTVYKLRANLRTIGRDFEVAPLRARWPDAYLVPKTQWHAIWALPVPDETATLPQKFPHVLVELELWEYGAVAQLLHVGPYSEEGSAVQRLQHFIDEAGYEISGAHEEEYLTGPTGRVQKTIIRYPVTPKHAFATLDQHLTHGLVLTGSQ